MLLIADILENKERILQGLHKRGLDSPEEVIEKVLNLDTQRKETKTNLDRTLAESNGISKQIGQLMRQGEHEKAEAIKKKTAELRTSGKELQHQLSDIESTLKTLLYQIPNVPHQRVPEGSRAEDNAVLEECERLPVLSDSKKPHWDLIKDYDIIDFDLGNKVTGAGFPVYKGKGARLQRALINFFLDEAIKAGYAEIQPPIVINEASGYGTGQLPDKEGQMYHVQNEDFYLIPTAEVPITNLYREVILSEADLPVKHVGYTPCFRREAGSWGAHVRGLNRLHQFDKVEIVQIALPSRSYEVLEEMLQHVVGLLKKLDLPYRILNLCGGDLGFTAALTYDLEVYSAAQEQWLEVSSVSNFETYQANRLKLRYKSEGKKTTLLHTLNGSALALPRIMAAILENNQKEGGIKIPEVLWEYAGFKEI
ncbi:serine--tRNA ligase [Fulvivirgaceae bacterium BMA12]|uniref:Serine--tRNA ligase n=1 Tax=Agaribacillus aureus TaxID=3051825 RepID=A0ABT8L896_9BACT|nr:serine--tRNA ligase [Fulvivirgaceae bacterium BMA12]